MRREMKDAIEKEDYERASELRDRINSIEGAGR
ncbi:MAG: UvrB/UvrC motif-containing protein [Planctomycetota bacterium]